MYMCRYSVSLKPTLSGRLSEELPMSAVKSPASDIQAFALS